MKLNDPIVLILAAIQKKELTQYAVAKKIGMLPCQFNETLKGKRKISFKVAFRIQDALGVNAETILRMQFDNELNQLKQVRKLLNK